MDISEVGSEEAAVVNDGCKEVKENSSPNEVTPQAVSEVASNVLPNSSPTHKCKVGESLEPRITEPPEELAMRVEEAAKLPPEASPAARNFAKRLVGLADSTEDIAAILEENPPEEEVFRPEPNLLLRAIEAGLQFEKSQMEKLSRLEEVAQNHLNTIDELLDLNAKIAALPDKDSTLPQEIKDCFVRLKEKGIDLWSGNKLPKEKRGELKSLINSRIDAFRTKITTTFNNMQSVIQEMNSVNETVKHILQQYTRQLMATLTRNQRPGG